MNLPSDPNSFGFKVLTIDEHFDLSARTRGDRLAFSYGHRQARHAAVKLATQADNKIQELKARVKEKDARIRHLEQLLENIRELAGLT